MNRTLKKTRTFLFLASLALAAPARAQPVPTLPGSCAGGASDCTTSVGHDSVSVASTLTINEQRAIHFGNIAVACGVACDGTASIDLGLDGSRTYHDGIGDHITLLNGGLAGGDPGGQSPGHYTVEGANEGGSSQVYVSFANDGGNPMDISGDNYYAGTVATLTGPTGQTFTMDKFAINESGHDVYGHYIDNRGGAFNPAPGSSNPFDHSHTPSAAGIDVVVGATLHTASGVAAPYAPGKYVGTFNIMVSY